MTAICIFPLSIVRYCQYLGSTGCVALGMNEGEREERTREGGREGGRVGGREGEGGREGGRVGGMFLQVNIVGVMW